MFLNRFKNKRKLGAGGFGMVYHVEDQDGQQYALKLIPMDELNKLPILKKYLEGEIKCMKAMNNPHLIQLHDTFQDKNFIFLLLEFCEGGDLSTLQGKFMNRVFKLDKAIEVLVDVLKGLEYLHGEGYLHRDIKLENILLKKVNDREMFKLADFGFSKPKAEIKGTNLGTQQYKAPEIFMQKQYGYSVDMWAFGVLFFIMINRQFPFRLSGLPFGSSELKKGAQIIRQAQKFSYRASVEKSRLKLTQNCTPQMQDLFTRIFEPNPEKRINFIQLRQHPLFIQNFPKIQQSSKLIYSKKISTFRMSEQRASIPKKGIEQNVVLQMSRSHVRNQEFVLQKQLLGSKKDQIDFLRENMVLFREQGETFQYQEILMISFNLLKQFKRVLDLESLQQRYPGHKWGDYLKTKQFKEFLSEVEDDISQHQVKFFGLFDECESYLPAIKDINPDFQAAFQPTIQDVALQGKFKKSYRRSTAYFYSSLLKLIKQTSGNKLYFLLTMVVISHAFNNIFTDMQSLEVIFKQFLIQKKVSAKNIDYSQLRMWLSERNGEALLKVAKAVIRLYLTPQ